MESEGGSRSRRRGLGSGGVAAGGSSGGGGVREVAPLQVMLTQQVEAEVAHKLKTLEEQRQHKLWMAQRWREYAQRNLEHTYASQVQQAQDEFEFERQELLDRLIGPGGSAAGGRSKGGRQGQRGAANGAAGADGNVGANRMVTRTSSRRRTRQQASAEASMMDGGSGGDGGANAQLQAKLRKLNPPLISYTLTDDEIVEDLSIICNRLGAFSNDMKKTMFQEALGYPPAPSLPPPNNYPASPSSTSTSAASPPPSSNTLPPLSPNNASLFSPSASPPRTSAFAHKLTTPQQQDPFAAPS